MEDPDLSYAAIAATMELSRLRSAFIIGAALVAKYPTDEEWFRLVEDPIYVESLNDLAVVINEISQDSQLEDALTPETVALAASKHHGRALDSIALIADTLGVPPEDLLSVLINA